MMKSMVFGSLNLDNVARAHTFLEEMATAYPGMAIRPLEMMQKVAEESEGIIAIQPETRFTAGLFCLYPTQSADYREGGSLCVHPDFKRDKISITLLYNLLYYFYAKERNERVIIIGDVLKKNRASLAFLQKAGFICAPPPDWYLETRSVKASNTVPADECDFIRFDVTRLPVLEKRAANRNLPPPEQMRLIKS